jgi:hypothetical protein
MTQQYRPAEPQRFAEAWRRFDEENARDPNQQIVDGVAEPRELVYSRWLTDWVLRLCPDASEELRLAARSQHLCRWLVPRSDYPMTRAGYLRWREALKKLHAEKAGAILRQVGYAEAVIGRVQALNLKQGFPNDPEGRVLEDALCLVFLQHQLGELASKTSEEKIINALKKSWQKMTPAGQAVAKNLALGDREKRLLEKALS